LNANVSLLQFTALRDAEHRLTEENASSLGAVGVRRCITTYL